MRRTTVLSIAFVLLLVSLPLISLGTINEVAWMWWLGLGLLAVGLLTAPALRLAHAVREARDEPDVGEEPS